MQWYWPIRISNILPWTVYVRQLHNVYIYAEVHSCQQDSIENLARCLALPANQPHMLHQRYNGCDTTSSLFKIGKRIAYNMLVVNIRHLLSLAEVGQVQCCDQWSFLCKDVYMLLLYGVKINSCQSLNQLRYNYASKSDKSASLFPPTNGTFQQYTIKYQVALRIHTLEARLVVWNPDGNVWQLRDNKLKHAMRKKMRPRKKFEFSNISIASIKTKILVTG